MEKLTNILTKLLLTIISLLLLLTIITYAFQKSFSKNTIESIVNETDTSDILALTTNDNTNTYVSVNNYLEKELEKIGIFEDAIEKEFINNFTDSLIKSVLTETIYNYINDKSFIKIQESNELREIKQLLTKEQNKKLDQIISNLNKEIDDYLDKVFKQNKTLKYIKIINKLSITKLLIIMLILILITFVIYKDRLMLIAKYIKILISNLVMILTYNIIYNNVIIQKLSNMEKYGKSSQMFLNDFIMNVNYIWKILVIITIVLSIVYAVIYILVKKLSKK